MPTGGGAIGALTSPGRTPPPPANIRGIVLSGKLKFLKRPEMETDLGTQTFFASAPPPPYGDVGCAGQREQAHVSTTKSSSVVPQVPFGSAVTSDWISLGTYREHSVKLTPCLFPQAIARALQVLHLRVLNLAKPAVALHPPPPRG